MLEILCHIGESGEARAAVVGWTQAVSHRRFEAYLVWVNCSCKTMDPSDPANASPPEAGRSRFRSQRQFFSFMRHTLPRLGLFDIKPLPQDKEWRESSCSSNIFARRSKDIDKALARCNDWRRISNVLINRSLVLCEDDAECNQSLIRT